jgi:hypothetical protein
MAAAAARKDIGPMTRLLIAINHRRIGVNQDRDELDSQALDLLRLEAQRARKQLVGSELLLQEAAVGMPLLTS